MYDPAPASCDGQIYIDLAQACQSGQPRQNDLGGTEVRYENVTFFGGEHVDLVVTATSTYNVSSTDTPLTGCSGLLGMVAVQAGTSVDLTFAFQNGVTRAPVTLSNFAISFLALLKMCADVARSGQSHCLPRKPFQRL